MNEKDYELKQAGHDVEACHRCAFSGNCGDDGLGWTAPCGALGYWVKRPTVADLSTYELRTAPASCPDPCKICALDGDACLQLPKARAICSSTAVDGGGYWVPAESSDTTETEGAVAEQMGGDE